jgi:membrane protein implicated in regulation of membrane protease activity
VERLFFFCAVIGGTISVCQFLLGLLGLGDHHDLGGDDGGLAHGFDSDGSAHGVDPGGSAHDQGGHEPGLSHESATSRFIGVLSFRTIVAAVTFFGLAGLAANAHGAHPAGTLAFALCSGVTALYVVAWTMRLLSRLRSDGTVRIQNTLGLVGVVYLAIPGHQAGRGKVTITVQNRTMEYEALTDQNTIPTGAPVQVVAIVDPETLAVAAAPDSAAGR